VSRNERRDQIIANFEELVAENQIQTAVESSSLPNQTTR
jgi:hypothetical protein